MSCYTVPHSAPTRLHLTDVWIKEDGMSPSVPLIHRKAQLWWPEGHTRFLGAQSGMCGSRVAPLKAELLDGFEDVELLQEELQFHLCRCIPIGRCGSGHSDETR